MALKREVEKLEDVPQTYRNQYKTHEKDGRTVYICTLKPETEKLEEVPPACRDQYRMVQRDGKTVYVLDFEGDKGGRVDEDDEGYKVDD